MNYYIYVKWFFFIVVVQAEVRIAVNNAVRMALCIECSPVVQEIQDSIPTETHRSRMYDVGGPGWVPTPCLLFFAVLEPKHCFFQEPPLKGRENVWGAAPLPNGSASRTAGLVSGDCGGDPWGQSCLHQKGIYCTNSRINKSEVRIRILISSKIVRKTLLGIGTYVSGSSKMMQIWFHWATTLRKTFVAICDLPPRHLVDYIYPREDIVRKQS